MRSWLFVTQFPYFLADLLDLFLDVDFIFHLETELELFGLLDEGCGDL